MTDSAPSSEAQLEAWRRGGADRIDPVRFRFIEAMTRRAAAHTGEARRQLDARLQALLAAYGEGVPPAAGATPPPATPAAMPPKPTPLGDLLTHIAAQSPPADVASAAPQGAADLKALRYFRSTWSRLNADRQLNQSQAKMPENAGPLNSQHLVHRAITLLRDVSPDYLNRLMAYVDGLSWIEQSNAAAPANAPGRPEGRKPNRGKGAR